MVFCPLVVVVHNHKGVGHGGGSKTHHDIPLSQGSAELPVFTLDPVLLHVLHIGPGSSACLLHGAARQWEVGELETSPLVHITLHLL
jgi:hypothetical protein